jgi:hypothetical protein
MPARLTGRIRREGIRGRLTIGLRVIEAINPVDMDVSPGLVTNPRDSLGINSIRSAQCEGRGAHFEKGHFSF